MGMTLGRIKASSIHHHTRNVNKRMVRFGKLASIGNRALRRCGVAISTAGDSELVARATDRTAMDYRL